MSGIGAPRQGLLYIYWLTLREGGSTGSILDGSTSTAVSAPASAGLFTRRPRLAVATVLRISNINEICDGRQIVEALLGLQGWQHQPAGHPIDVRGHRGQFDLGVLQKLFQPFHLPDPLPGDRRPDFDEVPQRPHQLRTNEALSTQNSEPSAVCNISLRPETIQGRRALTASRLN